MKKVLKPLILILIGFYIAICLSIINFASHFNPYVSFQTWFAAILLFILSILLAVFGIIKRKQKLIVAGPIIGLIDFIWFLFLCVLWYIAYKRHDDDLFKVVSDLFKLVLSFGSFVLFLVGFIVLFSKKDYKELKPREKKSQIENQQNDSDQETQTENTKKSPSKFKRVLVNTKRVNSPNYVGSLSDYFGSGYENGRFINVDLKENKIIFYSNNEDDVYMSADDVESLEFEGKTEWYSSGSVSAIDCMIHIVGKDGKQGTIKTPVAKWGSGQNRPYLNTDPINRALKVLGASFRVYIKLYRITFISSKGQTKTDYRIAADDEALKKECESLGEKLLKYDVI